MRLRFLAAAGRGPSFRQLEQKIACSTGENLLKVSSSDALTLWADRQTPIVHGNAGKSALVGLLFDRASGEPVDRLPSSSDLERLITRDFWGAYVLLTTDGSSHSVLRDPSAAVPVYCGRAEGLEIYATDADLLALARPERFRPELDFIRHWLTFPFLRTWRTGAAGVRELLPGTARRVDSAGEQLIEYWTPSRPARPRPLVTSLADAAALLRDEALRTIARFALAGEEIVLNLSGGLDSSIVAAALAQHIPMRITAANPIFIVA